MSGFVAPILPTGPKAYEPRESGTADIVLPGDDSNARQACVDKAPGTGATRVGRELWRSATGQVVSVAGKTVLLAGAGCPLGVSLAHVMAEAGAIVIAADKDSTPLMALARAYPGRIEPLSLDFTSTQTLVTIGGIWGADPLDVIVSLLPLIRPDDLDAACRVPEILVRAFAPALATVGGMAVLAVPEARGPAHDHARRVALLALAEELDRLPDAPPGGVHALCLDPDAAGDPGPVPDMILTLVGLLAAPAGARWRGGRMGVARHRVQRD